MNLILIIGFSAIAGLLAGYVSARTAPRWVFWTLCAACVAAFAGAVAWANTAGSDPLLGVVVLVGIVAPFVGCTIIAGILGLVVRAFADKSEVS